MHPEDVWLDIKPMTYEAPQRIEAVTKAAELGFGVRMEVGNTSTSFYASPTVPVGQVEVWMARTYSGHLEHATTLMSAEEPFEAWGWEWPEENFRTQNLQARAFHEALVAVQDAIAHNLPITEDTVLRIENPYHG